MARPRPAPSLAPLPAAALAVNESDRTTHRGPPSRLPEPPYRADRGRGEPRDLRAVVGRGARILMADEHIHAGGSPAPPAGEPVHLPGPSYLPVVTAVGLTFAVVGIV